MSNFSEKGVSLYLAIIIMSILIAMVLAMGTILFYQLRITKEIGSSVVAFYAADTGIENALYDENKCLRRPTSTPCAPDCRDDNGDNACEGVRFSYSTSGSLSSSGAMYDVNFITSPSNGFHASGDFRESKRMIEITGSF